VIRLRFRDVITSVIELPKKAISSALYIISIDFKIASVEIQCFSDEVHAYQKKKKMKNKKYEENKVYARTNTYIYIHRRGDGLWCYCYTL